MPQSTWVTAFMLASGAAVGALITYRTVKQPSPPSSSNEKRTKKKPDEQRQSFARNNSLRKSNSYFNVSTNVQAENLADRYHLPHDVTTPQDHEHHHRLQEAMDKRDRLPSLIILVRHGESEGNADHTLYRTKPDNLVALTQKGINQAKRAGKRVEEIFTKYDMQQQKGSYERRLSWTRSLDNDDSSISSVSSLEIDEVINETDTRATKAIDRSATSITATSVTSTASASSFQPIIKRVHLVISPFERTLQTASALRSGFEHRIVRTDIQARIREQEFGNLQGDDFENFREEQKKVGRFWYRFPTGESGSDVSDRVQSWWHDSVLNVNERVGYAPIDALVVVTHGLTMRFVLMQLYGWSPTTFHSVWNAENCDIYVLKKDLTKPGLSPYVLDETLGGNMPKSSIDLMVEFHSSTSAEEDAELKEDDEDDHRPTQKLHQKQFKLSDYLSIPPPRTTQLNLVKKKLVEQYPEDIGSVDRIKSIIFMPFIDGQLMQGRSTSGLLAPQDYDEADNQALAANGPVESKPTKRTSLADKRSRQSTNGGRKSKVKAKSKFPYYPEVQDDSWRPKQKESSVIAERNFR